MKAGGGKQKGANFEREVCKVLSLWITKGTHDDIFWRSSMSGGRATVSAKKGIQNRTQCGDITAIHPLGNALTDKYIISCKFYKDVSLDSAVFGRSKGGLNQFWLECVAEAKRYNKIPMLIVKKNNTPTFICLNAATVHKFKLHGNTICWLPLAGGFQILWFSKFIEVAPPPC